MLISRILHAGYLFASDEKEGERTTQIAFDPIFEVPFSRNCHPFPPVAFDHAKIRALRLDAVFISHHHDDHCSLGSLDLIDRKTPIYVYCQNEEMIAMIRRLGFGDVHSLEVDRMVAVGEFEVTPRLALDPDVDSIFHVRSGHVNVLNVVDAWIDPSALEILSRSAPWDVVLWPFQTMREIEVLSPKRAAPPDDRVPHEWIEQLRILRPHFVVPSSCQFQQESWSWYNQALFPVSYERFAREIGEAMPEVKVLRLDPSTSIRVGAAGCEAAPRLDWVELKTNEIVDYRFDPDLIPPATREVAKYFPALTSNQCELVLEFCRAEIGERYRKLPRAEESYFDRPRVWSLMLYDHEGAATRFRFLVDATEMSLLSVDNETGGPVAWTTEIPVAKLHSALTAGESLTSMYVRINDMTFPPEIEAEIAVTDPLEDPLVRCLYTGVFGEYQRAQLTELLNRP